MRRSKSKIRAKFTCNNPDSEMAKLLEDCTIEKEVCEAFSKKGKDFYKLDAETRMEIICNTLN